MVLFLTISLKPLVLSLKLEMFLYQCEGFVFRMCSTKAVDSTEQKSKIHESINIQNEQVFSTSTFSIY